MWIFGCSYLLRYLFSSGVSTAGSILRPSFFVGILQLDPLNLETKGKLRERAWGTLSRFTPWSFIGKAYFVDMASDTCTIPFKPYKYYPSYPVFLLDSLEGIPNGCYIISAPSTNTVQQSLYDHCLSAPQQGV